MTLLSIVQDAVDDIGGFDVPATVVGNTDARQYLRLLNREGEALSRHPWEILIKEDTITLVTADQDYALASDYRYMIPHTQYNRDDQRPLIWINSREWQFFKGWTTVNGLNLRARIRNNELEFEQTITSGDNGKTIAYEYVSKNWTLTSGAAAQQKFAADDDTSVLDEELLTLGLIWRFKKAKGLEFQTDLMEYSNQVKLALARDGGSRDLELGRDARQHLGVNTPEGTYPSA
jgi:hypothetical protein